MTPVRPVGILMGARFAQNFPSSIEAHRLVCLSHNLHVKDLSRSGTPRYFWSFTSTWHAFQALLQPSALAGGADLQRTHTELAVVRNAMSQQNLEEEVGCGQTD